MKLAHIITDLGFGDSGKGVTTDRLAALHAINDVVVIRSTGGSNAGHTVNLNHPGTHYPDKVHVHSSFPAGALGGFRGHMSHYCPIYPQKLAREGVELQRKLIRQTSVNSVKMPTLFSVDPLAPMITIFDVAWNRMNQKGHNTVGIGLGATMERMLHAEARTYMGDLLHRHVMEYKLRAVHDYYAEKLKTYGDVTKFEAIMRQETRCPEEALAFVSLQPTGDVIRQYEVVIFEGAQGVMLDQDHGLIPHTTWAYTTSRNAVEMINAYGTDEATVVPQHITRAYQTRHGDGPMTTPESMPVNDSTNGFNDYQGPFRAGPIDASLLEYASKIDHAYLSQLSNRFTLDPSHLSVTCCDHIGRAQLGGLLLEDVCRRYKHVHCWAGPYRNGKKQENPLEPLAKREVAP